jgi:hypothetical protein
LSGRRCGAAGGLKAIAGVIRLVGQNLDFLPEKLWECKKQRITGKKNPAGALDGPRQDLVCFQVLIF